MVLLNLSEPVLRVWPVALIVVVDSVVESPEVSDQAGTIEVLAPVDTDPDALDYWGAVFGGAAERAETPEPVPAPSHREIERAARARASSPGTVRDTRRRRSSRPGRGRAA